MTIAPDRSQRIAELEHALANGFPSQSTVVVHADDASGRLTIQVSWVRVPSDDDARQWRCAVDLRFDPDVLTRYASLGTADRLRVRTHVCDMARRAVDEQKPRVEDAEIECSVALDVTRDELDRALRAP
ncbi:MULTISPECIES: DUF3022 domain-containing protein [unclassified Burkholderia]|uniref:DUF3022 domain-containing protein n=1 Tax=unclassified Burkholderia TaxID=2613784 RepID=UPI00075F31ED|nr:MULTISPECIES: DUF3022 domain-containing protein [unclassified Burkholderia]AOJ90726.1 hypothetical protein WS87_28530 [Burkholderia sp. MSMB0856]KUY55035.1 hypothetical protein WS45_01455 [Burkholderia sp. RF2-non_BP3]KUY71298.1 hypothetical protein WS46_30055 [Burkholderia sp. RF4-BP95]KUY90385.1 hypothetical protein WS49_31105 [Burkholderia sp. RF7-non_BP4]KUZ03620.1 hypothetical protein WS48_03305 [Burkholderia sp. RF7-non_BP1]